MTYGGRGILIIGRAKDLQKRVYIWITLIITIPMLFFGFLNALHQKQFVEQKAKLSLMMASTALSDRLESLYSHMISIEDAARFSKEERGMFLERSLQPLVSELSVWYPNISMGYYSTKLQTVVAAFPAMNEESARIEPFELSSELRTDGRPLEFETAASSTIWSGESALILRQPVMRNAEMIGYSWVAFQKEVIDRDFGLNLLKTAALIFALWVLTIFIVGLVYRSHTTAVNRLANAILRNKQTDLTRYKAYPPIMPLVEKIRELRDHLQEESQHYLHETQKLQQIIDTSPVGILAVDRDGMITAYNKTFFRRVPVHYQNSSLIGHSYKEFIEQLGFEYKKTLIFRGLQGEHVNSEIQHFSDRTYLGFAAPIMDSRENILLGAVALAEDVTEVHQLRKELGQLERLRLVGQMAASITHEIRNPMAVIRGFMQLMKHKAGEELQEYCSIVISEVDRSNTIINDFLALAQDRIVTKEMHNLSDVVKDIYPLLAADANMRGIELELRLAEELPLLMLDDREMKQLLLNLVRNAMDAIESTGQKGIVTVTTSVEENAVVMRVSDTGCGMTEKQQQSLFHPFYSTKKDGTGLGLAVCLSIVERHSGKITVQSEEGKGTTFAVILFKAYSGF
ncbi:two-component system sensor histidine kinase NtrB [Paenibacillus turpanensis]|uniref:two-component system sensor histidine kinase NtrB n=1 Tax=Paenibacillus turpanensis TaxID=2689078 RepID=UPI001408428A|nr:ATP-binding protein [Paenibacillus turpanensis]